MIPFRYWPIVLIYNTLHGCWVENGQIVPWKMGKWWEIFFQIEWRPTFYETNIGCYIRFALFCIILALCVIHTITIICCSDFFSWDSIFGHPSNFSRRQTFQKMHSRSQIIELGGASKIDPLAEACSSNQSSWLWKCCSDTTFSFVLLIYTIIFGGKFWIHI